MPNNEERIILSDTIYYGLSKKELHAILQAGVRAQICFDTSGEVCYQFVR
jgi:hypothetical protein